MSNFVALLTSIVAISEVIIQATKEKASKKIDITIWSSIVLGIVSIGGIVFDIVFNSPVINPQYVFECVGLVALCLFIPQASYDKCIEIIDIVKKLMK